MSYGDADLYADWGNGTEAPAAEETPVARPLSRTEAPADEDEEVPVTFYVVRSRTDRRLYVGESCDVPDVLSAYRFDTLSKALSYVDAETRFEIRRMVLRSEAV